MNHNMHSPSQAMASKLLLESQQTGWKPIKKPWWKKWFYRIRILWRQCRGKAYITVIDLCPDLPPLARNLLICSDELDIELHLLILKPLRKYLEIPELLEFQLVNSKACPKDIIYLANLNHVNIRGFMHGERRIIKSEEGKLHKWSILWQQPLQRYQAKF